METKKAERGSENGKKRKMDSIKKYPSTVVSNFPSVNLGTCTHACIYRFFAALKLICTDLILHITSSGKIFSELVKGSCHYPFIDEEN